MITTEDLSYEIRGKPIVDSVSLEVEKGELVAVVGPNGAGKSSLVGLIAGDLPPSGGSASVNGLDVRRTPSSRMALVRTVMPQQSSIRFPFTVHEVVMMGRHPHLGRWRPPSETDFAQVEQAMRQTGVWHLKDRVYNTLSGGEQRRTALARAFAQSTEALLLDEPTSALDIGHQELVMARCREKADAGCAVLMVLHDLNVAAAYADRIAVMKDGRLAAFGRPEEVIEEAAISDVFGHPVVVFGHPCSGCPVVLPDATGSGRPRFAGIASAEARQPVETR